MPEIKKTVIDSQIVELRKMTKIKNGKQIPLTFRCNTDSDGNIISMNEEKSDIEAVNFTKSKGLTKK
jgi:hypothetical protein